LLTVKGCKMYGIFKNDAAFSSTSLLQDIYITPEDLSDALEGYGKAS